MREDSLAGYILRLPPMISPARVAGRVVNIAAHPRIITEIRRANQFSEGVAVILIIPVAYQKHCDALQFSESGIVTHTQFASVIISRLL